MNFIYFNGKYLPEKAARISPLSSAAMIGEGVFTSTLVENGKVLFFDEHIARLKKHAEILSLDFFDITLEEINTLIRKNKMGQGKWRLRLTLFSKQPMEKRIRDARRKLKPSDFMITLSSLPLEDQNKVILCVYPEVITTPFNKVKTLNYLSRFYLKNYALSRGFDDILTLNNSKKILESSFSNIFWLDKDEIFLPDRSLPYFSGICLNYLIKKFNIEGYKIREGLFEVHDIPSSAHVYLCNSVRKVIPVVQIEKRHFEIHSNPFSGFFTSSASKEEAGVYSKESTISLVEMGL
jgi:branched-subunit amino acid aminotransferase/4-amino-4-deoxychorismate lyase